jgi:class 3 adenylate cyclase
LATQILVRQQEVIGERKYATVVVAGIESLPALHQVGAPEEIDDLLNQGFAQVVAEVHRVEGFLTQVTSHGGIALFGVPLACEDHVLRALHAALGMQRVFTAFATALHQTYGVVLTLRLGVHTGPVVVSAISSDLRLAYTTPGTTIIEGATGLQQLSRDGAIVVSAPVQQQATGFFRFTVMGTHLFPELAEPVDVYTCDGVGLVTSRLVGVLARGQTTLQGRMLELAILEDCWTRVCRGAGQVVCLVGEAGIGKSRLTYECQQRLADARWLTLQALSYGQATPYHAILPLLRTMLGVVDTAPPIQQLQAIRTRLAAIAASLAADTPLLAHLLGVPLEMESLPALTPDAQRRRLQQVCLQVLLHQATATPLGLLVEDGHWLDPSSQELLDLLVVTLARRSILVLCTARPGFRPPWADYTYFHQMAIAPLAAEETYALLGDLLRPYDVSAALKALIHERTGGNPFFVEELVRALQARAPLTVQGAVYEVAPAARGILPYSIQGLIQARLDQLPAAEKRLLQVMAVVGPVAYVCFIRTGGRCRRRGNSEPSSTGWRSVLPPR